MHEPARRSGTTDREMDGTRGGGIKKQKIRAAGGGEGEIDEEMRKWRRHTDE